MPAGDPCSPGSGVRAILEAMDAIAGPDRVARAIASLPPELREEFQASRALAWVPLRLTTPVMDAVARELGQDPDDFSERVVRDGSRRALSTIYRAVMRFTWDDALVARAPMLYSRMRDVGTMTAQITAPGRAEAIITGWPAMTARNARSIAASIGMVLELAGRDRVVVQHELEHDGALFRCTWQK